MFKIRYFCITPNLILFGFFLDRNEENAKKNMKILTLKAPRKADDKLLDCITSTEMFKLYHI